MADGLSIRRFLAGAFHVDVNPLVVAGRIGEEVDAILTDFHPIGDGESLHRDNREVRRVLRTLFLPCRDHSLEDGLSQTKIRLLAISVSKWEMSGGGVNTGGNRGLDHELDCSDAMSI